MFDAMAPEAVCWEPTTSRCSRTDRLVILIHARTRAVTLCRIHLPMWVLSSQPADIPSDVIQRDSAAPWLGLRDFNTPGTNYLPMAINFTKQENAYNTAGANPAGSGPPLQRFALWPQTNVLRWNVSGGEGSGPSNGITFPVIVHLNTSVPNIPNQQIYNTLVTFTAGNKNFTSERTAPYLFTVCFEPYLRHGGWF